MIILELVIVEIQYKQAKSSGTFRALPQLCKVSKKSSRNRVKYTTRLLFNLFAVKKSNLLNIWGTFKNVKLIKLYFTTLSFASQS